MIVNVDFDLQGDINEVINNAKYEVIEKAKTNNPYSIYTSSNFLKHNKTYGIFYQLTFGLINKLSKE